MAPDPDDNDRSPWRVARSFDDLAELTARFIEGDLAHFPGWLAADTDEETDEIAEDLAAINRLGFMTLASQPGRAPHKGFGGHTFAQRAFVAGFASAAAARALDALSAEPELVITSCPTDQTGGCKLPVGRRGDEMTAWAGHAAGPEELAIFAEVLAPEALRTLERARYVSIIDPHWGNRELLWRSLRRALEESAHAGRDRS